MTSIKKHPLFRTQQFGSPDFCEWSEIVIPEKFQDNTLGIKIMRSEVGLLKQKLSENFNKEDFVVFFSITTDLQRFYPLGTEFIEIPLSSVQQELFKTRIKKNYGQPVRWLPAALVVFKNEQDMMFTMMSSAFGLAKSNNVLQIKRSYV